MIALYLKETCPFSRRVIATLERLAIPYEGRDVVMNDAFAAELIERGGKRQTPYLVDTEHDFAGYESDVIIDHLERTYGQSVPVADQTTA